MGVSTPAHPMIFNSAAEDGGTSEEFYVEGMPLVGEAKSRGLIALDKINDLSSSTVLLQVLHPARLG